MRRVLHRCLGAVRSSRIRGIVRRGSDWIERRVARRHLARSLWAKGVDALGPDPGIDTVVDACADWLRTAQDRSASCDGGVAAHYGLIGDWSKSYPETSGYIVPTLLAYARLRGDEDARDRARRVLDWLVRNQLPEGGFRGGLAHARPIVSATFNTGQILLGLVAGHREFGCFREPLIRAADWLVATQDADGCWRAHPSPFARAGDKVYDTHVAWSLFEADRVAPGHYASAAMANVRWALTHQRSNGFLDNCCLNDRFRPLTHTLGYALRGFLEAFRASGDATLLPASRLTADALLGCLDADGFLPGRLSRDWHGAADWSCLVGTCQVAHCWLALYQVTGEVRYLEAGQRANAFVRRTVAVDGPASGSGRGQGFASVRRGLPEISLRELGREVLY